MARRLSSPIFVGRRDELDRLTRALADVSAGHPTMLVVASDAGIGKTRLVAQFAGLAGDAGARVLTGGCVRLGDGGLPNGPIVEVLRRLSREVGPAQLDRLLGPARRELARLAPFLHEEGGPPDTRPGAQSQFFELFLGFLGRLSAQAPLVLVVEDLHWADRATLDLLTFLARNLSDERVLLLATCRTDETHRRQPLLTFLAEFERSGTGARLELGPFNRAEMGELVAGILAREPAATLVSTIHARSQGNAFFAEELLASGEATGPLPPTLREVLLDRLDDLAETTQELLRVASAAGSRIDANVLAGIGTIGRDALTGGFREAVSHHVLVPLEGDGDLFAFRHALLGEAVYSELLPGERRRLHAGFAEALESNVSVAADPLLAAELAHHWDAAGNLPRALAASVQAGLAARSVYAFADAQTQFERACQLWPRVPEATELAGMDLSALLELTAETASASGAHVRAVAHMRAALRLVDTDIDPLRAALMNVRLGFLTRAAGDREGSAAAYEEAIRLVPADPPSAARARALAGLGRRLMLDGEDAESLRVAGEAMAIARTTGARDVGADLLATIGAVQRALGDADDADATLREARDLARDIGDDETAIRAWTNLTASLEGEACVAEALAAAEWAGARFRGHAVRLLFSASLALWELGRWEEADGILERTMIATLEGENEVFPDLCRAQLEVGRGQFEAAAGRVERVRPRVDTFLAASSANLLATRIAMQVHHGRGALAEARAAADAAMTVFADLSLGRLADFGGLLASGLAVEADIAVRARARRRSAELTAAEERGTAILEAARAVSKGVRVHRATALRRPHAILALCEAEWARLAGTPDPARWSAAVSACGAAGQLHLRPYALFRQAEAVLARSRDRAAARPLLREAYVAADTMGAIPLRSKVAALARHARVALESTQRSPEESGLPPPPIKRLGLTRRQLDVLALVAAGRTNRQIGEALFIGERTAGVHVSNILGKLDVSSRTEAAALVYRLGLGPART